MCVIKTCPSRKTICLEHALLIDDTVELLIDEGYNTKKICNDLINRSSLGGTKNGSLDARTKIYSVDSRDFINARDHWDLIGLCISRGIFVPLDYRNRFVLEECVILAQLVDVYGMVAEHVYRDFFKRHTVKMLF